MPKVNNSLTNRISSHSDEPVTNKYYLLVSKRYMQAKYILILCLAAFIGISMILFRNEITYANLMYLIRDFNTKGSVYMSGFDPVEYDEQENMSFCLYRGELVVAGNRSVRMYNSKGQLNRSYEPGYTDPVLSASDKYIIAYDMGETSYSVYSSIAKVNDGVATGSIENADINNSGDHLLVCRSDETKYLVMTYDSAFRNTAKYYKNKYVTSAAIGSDGRVIIVSFDSTAGGYECEVDFFTKGAESADNKYTASDIFPLQCGIWENGNSFVLCTDKILFFDKSGNLLKTEKTEFKYTAYCEGNETLAVSCSKDNLGGKSDVIVFDTRGEMVYNNSISGNVSSVAVTEEFVCVLTGGTAVMMPFNTDKTMMADTDEDTAVLLTSGSSVLLCKRNGAAGLVFETPSE